MDGLGSVARSLCIVIKYRVRLVGAPMGFWIPVVAHNADEAIVKAAGCNPRHVRGSSSRSRVGTERYSIFRGDVWESWDVEDTRLTRIIEKLALSVGNSMGDDLPDIDAHGLAVDEVVNATGMLYPDARRLVHTWLVTLTSRHYDTIRLHLNK